MTTIQNTRELPRDPLRCFAVTQAEAERLATQYEVAYFYPAFEGKGYLYVLNSEYEQKESK